MKIQGYENIETDYVLIDLFDFLHADWRQRNKTTTYLYIFINLYIFKNSFHFLSCCNFSVVKAVFGIKQLYKYLYYFSILYGNSLVL